MKLIIKNARLSFADLFTAVEKFGGDPKFGASFLIDPKSDDGKANIAAFKEICHKLEKESFGGNPLPTDKYPIKDGNDKDYDGWKDMMVISSSNKKRPKIVGRKRQTVAEGDIDAPYSGCIVNAVVDVWPMDNQYGKRICCSLEAVQFAADGDPFSAGGANIESDFDDIDLSDRDITEVSAESLGI